MIYQNAFSRAKSERQLRRDIWQMICDDWRDYELGYTENAFWISAAKE